MKAHLYKKVEKRDKKMWQSMEAFMQQIQVGSSALIPLLPMSKESSDSSDSDFDPDPDDGTDPNLDHMDYP